MARPTSGSAAVLRECQPHAARPGAEPVWAELLRYAALPATTRTTDGMTTATALLNVGGPHPGTGPPGRGGGVMTEPEDVEGDLPELDCTDDPRSGAVAWALLAVGVAVVAGILLAVMWAAGAW
jgi:hypothetical protein